MKHVSMWSMHIYLWFSILLQTKNSKFRRTRWQSAVALCTSPYNYYYSVSILCARDIWRYWLTIFCYACGHCTTYNAL